MLVNDSPTSNEVNAAPELNELSGETVQDSAIEETVSENANEDTTTQDEHSEENSEDTTSSENEKKSGKGFEKRIERFNKKLAAKEAELEYWKNAAIGKGNQPAAQPTVTTTEAKPKFSDYNDLEAYTEALTDWKMDNKLRDVRAQQSTQTVQQIYQERVKEFTKTQPDFQNVMAEFQEDYGHIQIPEVVQVAFESEVGPQLAYYLATHTNEVDRIAALPPHRRLIELGKIEDKVSQANKPVAKIVSKAAAPLTPAKGTGKVTTKDIYNDDIPYSEWVKLRNKK